MYEMAKGENVEVLFSAAEIAARIKEVAKEITKDYAGKDVVLLGTLKGAVHFLSDLIREIPLILEIDFIKVSSYDGGTSSTGTVTMEYTPSTSLAGRHVILVEDIIDTGNSVAMMKKYLLEQGVASLKLCALMDKPAHREAEGLHIDYLCFTIPSCFVLGYGLDYAQKYRNLSYIGIMKFEN
ncbi:MAG: hypoxanthine phosphoribosyltransferase [Defluviitaleaceae bacterium]|nr:hypoxanthine phosphoribosyltransferase [Defluviitaleaceae bacterium]